MGGLIGGFLAAWLYCRAKKLDFLSLADMGAAGLAIGTAVGRIGDLVIGDHLGGPPTAFGVGSTRAASSSRPLRAIPAVYPSADGCIRARHGGTPDRALRLRVGAGHLSVHPPPGAKDPPEGLPGLTWAAMYSVGRILTDLTRVDKTWFGTGLTGSQLTAITALLLSLFGLVRIRQSPKCPR